MSPAIGAESSTPRRPRGGRPITAAIATGALLIVLAYGVAAQIRLAGQTGSSWTWADVASAAAWGMVGQDVATPGSDATRELVAALTVSTVLVLAWLAWALLRPPQGRATSTEGDWREAKRLVQEAGSDSLAYFALRRDKEYFFDERHTAFLAYRAVAGIALVSGDPVGDPSRRRACSPTSPRTAGGRPGASRPSASARRCVPCGRTPGSRPSMWATRP